MPFNLNAAWKVAQTIFGVAEVSRRVLNPAEGNQPQAGGLQHAGGLLGEVEARLTGVVVSALKEAFDRDAARLEAERAALEDQRRRADEALRLELVRQAGDRALVRARGIGALALAEWAVSVLFAILLRDGFGTPERLVLGASWAVLAGAIGSALAAHAAVARWLGTAQTSRVTAADLPDTAPSVAAPWLLLAGLVLTGVSVLLAL
jgi:hypothetical protein